MEVCRITSTQELIAKLAEQVPAAETKELTKTRIEVKVPTHQVRILAETLKMTLPDISGELVSGVDLTEDKYEVLWFLWSHSQKLMVIIKTRVEGPTPSVASLTDLWPGLEWHERETWEMFGIDFTGHPNLDLLLLSEDLRGKYPLRKSFVIDRSREDERTVAPPPPIPMLPHLAFEYPIDIDATLKPGKEPSEKPSEEPSEVPSEEPTVTPPPPVPRSPHLAFQYSPDLNMLKSSEVT